MKAAVVRELGGGFHVEELRIAEPIGREVLVDVRASGLCHSDLHIANNDFGMPLPMLLGHELAGVVVAVGPEVTEFECGQHVVGSLIQFCGHCQSCLSGHTYQCRNAAELMRGPEEEPRLTDSAGVSVFPAFGLGSFGEHVLVHENQLVAVPESIPFPQACVLGCATITGAGAAIHAAEVQVGDTVAVIGVGGVGLNVISGARIAGAKRIIAVDLSDEKLRLAEKFGATDVVNANANDPIESVMAVTNGIGVDHAFEVIGFPATTSQAIKMARVGGQVLLIGLHRPGAETAISLLDDVITPQRVIKGVFMGSTNMKRDIPMYAELYLQGRLNLDDLIAREITAEQINEAYEDLKGGTIARAVVTSW